MDSILRAFGRKTSKEAESNEKVKTEDPSGSHVKTSQITSDEDLFGNLVVCSPTSTTPVLASHHIQEIGDLELDVKLPSKSYGEVENKVDDDNNDGPSAFSFMNVGDEDVDIKSQNQSVDQDHNLISGNFPFIETEENEQNSDFLELAQDDQNPISGSFPFIASGENEENSLDSKKVKSVGVTIQNKEMVSDSSSKSTVSSSSINPSKPRNVPSGSNRPKKKRSVKPGFGNIEADHPKKSSPSTSSESTITFIDNINNTSMNSERIEDHSIEEILHETSKDEHLRLHCEHDEIHHDKHVHNRNGDISVEHDQDNYKKTNIDINPIDVNVDVDTGKAEILNNESKAENEVYVKDDTITEICTSNNDGIIEDVVDVSNSKDNVELHSNEDLPCINTPIDTTVVGESNNHAMENKVELIKENLYNIQFSEEDNVSSKVSLLQSREDNLKASRCLLFDQQKEFIDKWRTGHLSEDEILLKIHELRLLQSKLECDEDYDKAAEINQNIEDLMKQCENYRYQYPLLDEKYIELMEQYRNLSNNQKLVYNDILKEYEEMLVSCKTKNNEDEINEEKKLNEMNLLIKERKLKVERDISHTSLDKEHLAKTETILDEEIEKQTKELDREKCELVAKKIEIQENIQELMEKLKILKDDEHSLTTSISNVDSKIKIIMDGFQPRIDEISNEKDRNLKEESLLVKKMEDVVAEEELVQLRKTQISNQKEKNEETIVQITSVIQHVQKTIEANEKEIFYFDTLLDFEGLNLDSNSELTESKVCLETLKAKHKDITNKVLSDEAEEKRLQRTLNDLEAQLSELQSLKQVHVKERKYKDAKQTSDEIKKLTGQGEDISQNAMILNERIKTQKTLIQEVNDEVTKAQEKFSGLELAHDEYIIQKLTIMNNAIQNLLNGDLGRWTIGTLELQFFNNENIINTLTKKHGFSIENLSENMEIDVEAIQKSLVDLEKRLELAVSEEEWDCADEINSLIEEKKQIIADLNR